METSGTILTYLQQEELITSKVFPLPQPIQPTRKYNGILLSVVAKKRKEASLKHWPSRLFFLLALASGKRRSETHAWQTKHQTPVCQRCLCTQHPAFFPRPSWPRRAQTVWPQWLCQPWPQLWISPLNLMGPCVRSEHCAIYWDRTSDKTRS